MLSNLFWIIAAPFALAFIAGFLTYNLGAVPTLGDSDSEQ